LPEQMTPDEQEYFEERAAIREFDGIMPRKEAERLACLDILHERKERKS